MKDVNVVIVGGGIGGLANAVALSLKGLKVRVLERSSEFGEVGAGLQIAPNCTRILNQWGLLDEILSLGVAPDNIIMKDAIDTKELTRLDCKDMLDRYGFPYVVIHRSDLHGTLLRAAQRLGAELITDVAVVGYDQDENSAWAITESGDIHAGEIVIAADGIHSVARALISDDEPVSSNYVAYRGAVPMDLVKDLQIATKDVVVYVGPQCHFVQYPLRGGDMFNQVAVFQSPKAVAGEEDWGTPDELDGAFTKTSQVIQDALPFLWRDRWWRMFDRNPIMNWLNGRIALTGDSAHPPLQYLAQGGVMAIEDAWVLSEHVGRQGVVDPQAPAVPSEVDWLKALDAYNAVRPEHCRRVLSTGRKWGEFWHHDGEKRVWRNEHLLARDTYDYSWIDWVYAQTAMTPDEEPEKYPLNMMQ